MKYQFTIVLLSLCITSSFGRTTTWSPWRNKDAVHQHQHQSQYTTLEDVIAPPQRCDFRCTLADLAVCATNGECMHQFAGTCQMSAYNCKNPQKPFMTIEEWRCEQNWAPLCRPEQLGGEQV